METWIPIIAGNKLLEVSSCGHIRYLDGSYLKTHDLIGYVGISVKNRSEKVHRIVATAFIPNPGNKREINHINNIRNDNRIENLEWCTRQENYKHAISIGAIKSVKVKKYSKLGEFIAEYETIRECATDNNTKDFRIARVLNGERKSVGGFIYKSEGYVGVGGSRPRYVRVRGRRVKKIGSEGNILAVYKNLATAAKDNFISTRSIVSAISGERKTAAGYKWEISDS